MLVYHGTADTVGRRALIEGLKTRTYTGRKSIWPDAPSRDDAVYLTETYAIYFGMIAIATKRKLTDGTRIALVEIDTDKLTGLVPDEDALEQAWRKKDKVRGDLWQRTAWYRERLHTWLGSTEWQLSLQLMGTCAHIGNIPVSAITRVAFVDPLQQRTLCMLGMDPSITIMNFQIMGGKYRELTAAAFDSKAKGIEVVHP